MTDTLGPYELLRLLGRGGMGEVHLARDTRLEREVALKLLPAELASDPDRKARFLREARAAAALNHPNITTILEVGEESGRSYIAQEYLDGRSLAELVAERTLPLAELAALAVPLADALAYAHGRGVIHRDLKAANVVVTSRGDPKLLDFGLAKVLRDEEAAAADEKWTTLTVSGAIFGTPGAMSPEQALGRVVDARSDVFSFGSLLYEMASGKPAFLGTTVRETMDKVLHAEPEPLQRLRRDLPSDFVRIVDKALRKDPAQRYQGMVELAADLRHFKQQTDSGLLPPGRARQARSAARTSLALVGAGAVTAAGLLWWGGALGGADDADAPSVHHLRQLTYGLEGEFAPSLTADGETLYYTSFGGGDLDIFMRRVDGSRVLNLTEDHPGDDDQPAVSPDGRSVAFWSTRDGGGVYVMGSLGESPRKVCDFGFHPAWSPDGRRLAVCEESIRTGSARHFNSALWLIDVASGARERTYEGDAVQPQWSPDGSRLLAWQCVNGQRDLVMVPLDGSAPFTLTEDPALDWAPVFGDGGRSVVWSSNRSGSTGLWRIPIDETGHALGAPAPLTTGAGDTGMLCTSADGRRIVFGSEWQPAPLLKIPFDAATRRLGPAQPIALPFEPNDVSPDGRYVLGSGGTGQEDLYRLDTTTGIVDQLTDDAANDRGPLFLADCREILFRSNRSGTYQVWRARADGSELRLWTRVPQFSCSAIPTPAGDRLLLTGEDASSAGGVRRFFVVPFTDAPVERLPDPLPLPFPGTRIRFPQWSLDGRSIDWAVDHDKQATEDFRLDLETMRWEQRVVPSGFRKLVLLRDGREVWQDAADGTLRVVDADGQQHPVSGEARIAVIKHRRNRSVLDLKFSLDETWVFHRDRPTAGHLWLLER